MKIYETVFIVDSQIGNEGIEKSVSKFFDFIEGRSQEVLRKRKWGLRRLAYDIKGRQQGYYALINYVADWSVVRDLERELKLDESIIRYMTVVASKREVERLRSGEPHKTNHEATSVKSSSVEETGE